MKKFLIASLQPCLLPTAALADVSAELTVASSMPVSPPRPRIDALHMHLHM